jgi:dihydrofolate reductase (trimethoprim resistance protein)
MFEGWTFQMGDMVRKHRGGAWRGTVVGFYRTSLTPEGYAVESAFEPGSVQIYPVAALEPWDNDAGSQPS